MDDDQITAKLAELTDLCNDIKAMQSKRDALARELLTTRRWGIRARLASALGISAEAVRLRYGATHSPMPDK